ncbi:hypothetical protein ACFL5Z_12630 [Planctomycetota bacterium]
MKTRNSNRCAGQFMAGEIKAGVFFGGEVEPGVFHNCGTSRDLAPPTDGEEPRKEKKAGTSEAESNEEDKTSACDVNGQD